MTASACTMRFNSYHYHRYFKTVYFAVPKSVVAEMP